MGIILIKLITNSGEFTQKLNTSTFIKQEYNQILCFFLLSFTSLRTFSPSNSYYFFQVKKFI